MTQNYAQGGYIPPGTSFVLNTDCLPIQLSRGYTLMTYASYKALGPDMIGKLFKDTEIELVLTADEVREMGPLALERLQHELDAREDSDGLQ